MKCERSTIDFTMKRRFFKISGMILVCILMILGSCSCAGRGKPNERALQNKYFSFSGLYFNKAKKYSLQIPPAYQWGYEDRRGWDLCFERGDSSAQIYINMTRDRSVDLKKSAGKLTGKLRGAIVAIDDPVSVQVRGYKIQKVKFVSEHDTIKRTKVKRKCELYAISYKRKTVFLFLLAAEKDFSPEIVSELDRVIKSLQIL